MLGRRFAYQNEMQPSSTGWFDQRASSAEGGPSLREHAASAAARSHGAPFPPSLRHLSANDGSVHNLSHI
jgi:hypothetical protein